MLETPFNFEGIFVATGTVKFFNADKGFWFISQTEELRMCSFTSRPCRDGQKVSFNTEPDRMGKGPKAIDIELL
jgi:CspA family cold shock protein